MLSNKKLDLFTTRKINFGDFEIECAICFGIMVEPCSLKCFHIFCKGCLSDLFEFKRECPLCRNQVSSNFSPKINKFLQREIQMKFPILFKDRLREVKPIEIEFEIGNKHLSLYNQRRIIRNNGTYDLKHKWTVFVRIKDLINRPKIVHLIEKVRFIFHPSSKR